MVLRKTHVDSQEKIADPDALVSSSSGRLARFCRDGDAAPSSSFNARHDREQLGGHYNVDIAQHRRRLIRTGREQVRQWDRAVSREQ